MASEPHDAGGAAGGGEKVIGSREGMDPLLIFIISEIATCSWMERQAFGNLHRGNPKGGLWRNFHTMQRKENFQVNSL